MKKSLLLTVAALTAVSMSAQIDYAPEKWKFSEMPEGSAASLFIPTLASTGGNAKAPFRDADDGKGGVAVICYGGDGSVTSVDKHYADMPDEDKKVFEDFYNSTRIVKTKFYKIDENYAETGETFDENILCIIGNGAQSSYKGGEKSPVRLPNAQLMWLSGTQNSSPAMQTGANYRLTIDYRVIVPEQVQGEISLTIADAQYAGMNNGSYQSFNMPFYGVYSSDWNRGILDIAIPQDNDPTNKLPIAVKMNPGYGMLDQAVILFRSIKLEGIDEIEYGAGYSEDFPDFVDHGDASSSVEQINVENESIITVANGTITVIDANAPIEVYNIAGAKVASIATPSVVETIDIDMNGVFVVKAGNKVQKVIL